LSNLILKKTTTAIFLTIVLIGGTFAAISPSFITGVNAEPYYGEMDKDRKSDKKDVSVQSLKCNNINVNVNGLELSVLPPFLGGGEIAAESAELNTDASSFAGNGDGSEINDFRFICINNNNNTIIGEEPSILPVEDECVLCLNANATFAEIITRALEVPGPITISSSLFTLIIGEDITTIPELCDLLREAILAGVIDQSEQHLREVFYVVEFVDPDTDAVRFSESVISLVECLLDVDFS
jgi:hypothetical protein